MHMLNHKILIFRSNRNSSIHSNKLFNQEYLEGLIFKQKKKKKGTFTPWKARGHHNNHPKITNLPIIRKKTKSYQTFLVLAFHQTLSGHFYPILKKQEEQEENGRNKHPYLGQGSK